MIGEVKMNDLLEILHPVIQSGLETRKIDLKREFDLSERPRQARLAKLISALINTPGGAAYIVIGVMDHKDRRSDDPKEYIVGFNPGEADLFQRQVQQAVTNFLEPVPTVHFRMVDHPSSGKKLGVIQIPRSFNRPHRLKRDSGEIEQGVYLKRGSEIMPADSDEIQAMTEASQDNRLILNFHHALNASQLNQLRGILGALPEVLHYSGHFDNALPYSEEVVRILDGVGLTSEEWKSLNFIVNLPGYAYAAAVVLAEIHGRSGRFPHVLRLRPQQNDRNQYDIAEIIRLQNVRDDARDRFIR